MDNCNISSSDGEPFASDILRGAAQIAQFLFGDHRARRKVYHLVESSRVPHFRMGGILHARRSVLVEWIAEQERRGCPPRPT